MVNRNPETSEKGIKTVPHGQGHLPQAKFTVYGEEMIQKEVGLGGNAGRIYLPPGWVGKLVKIIRID